jgi:hypothetical protein
MSAPSSLLGAESYFYHPLVAPPGQTPSLQRTRRTPKIVTTATSASELSGHVHHHYHHYHHYLHKNKNKIKSTHAEDQSPSSVRNSPTVTKHRSKIHLLPTPLQRTWKRLNVVVPPTSGSADSPPDHLHDTKTTGSKQMAVSSPAASGSVFDCISTSNEDRDETTTTTSTMDTANDTSNDKPLDSATNRDSGTRHYAEQLSSAPGTLGTSIAFPKTRVMSLPLYHRSRPASISSSARRDVRSATIDERSVALDSDLRGLLEFLDGIQDFDEEEEESTVVSDTTAKDPIVNMLVMENAADLAARGLTAVISALSSSQFMSFDNDDGSSIDSSILRDLQYKKDHPEEFTALDLIMPPVMTRGADHKSVPSVSSKAVSETAPDEDSRQEPSLRSARSRSTLHSTAIVEKDPKDIIESATVDTTTKGISEQFTQPSVSENKASLTLLVNVSVRESNRSPSENGKIPILKSTSTISTAKASETDQLLVPLESLSTISSSVVINESYVSTSCSDDSEESGEKSTHSEASNDTSVSDEAKKGQLLSYTSTGSSRASGEIPNQWNACVPSPPANVEVNNSVNQEQLNGSTGFCCLDGYEAVCASLACYWKTCLQPAKVSDVVDNSMEHVVVIIDIDGSCADEPKMVEAASIHGNKLVCIRGDECASVADGSVKNNSKYPAKETATLDKTMAAKQASTEYAMTMGRADVQTEMNLPNKVDTMMSMEQEALVEYMDLQKNVDADVYACCGLCFSEPNDPACMCNDRVNQALDRSMKKRKGDMMSPAVSMLSANSRSVDSLSARPDGFGEERRDRVDSVLTLISSKTIIQTEACSKPPLCPAPITEDGKWRRFLGMRRRFLLLRRSKSKGSAAKTM